MPKRIKRNVSKKRRQIQRYLNRADVVLRAGQLISIANSERIKTPPSPEFTDIEEWAEDYPHFALLCGIHLGKKRDNEKIRRNAQVLSGIPDNEIKEMDQFELIEQGLVIQ